MSDRVAWIGGKTSGRDHLPPSVSVASDWATAVVTNDVNVPIDVEMANGRGDGYIFPFGFGPDDFLKYAVRVRKWHFDFTATIKKSVPIDPEPETPPYFQWEDGSASIEFDYQFAVDDDNVAVIPTREAQLVLSPERRYLSFNLLDDDTYSYPTPGINPQIDNISVSHTAGFIPVGGANALFLSFRQDIRFDLGPFFIDSIAGGGYGGWIAGEWWPRIQFFCGISANDTRCQTSWRGVYDDIGGAEAKGNLSLFGSNASIKGLPVGAADDNPGGLMFSAIDVAITPVEFWPFAARASSPIWDTSTGAQLQDPLG